MLAQLRTLLQNDSIRVSRSAQGVSDPRCNIVHIARAPPPRLAEQARRAAEHWTRRSVAAAADADADAEDDADAEAATPCRSSAVLRAVSAREDTAERGLVPQWLARTYPDLAEAIASDAGELARMVARASASAAAAASISAGNDGGGDGKGASAVSARLEALASQPCPRWHADTVSARALVTYAGPGTQYLPNARVRRGWDRTGAPVVAGVRLDGDGGGGGGGGGGAFAFEEAAPWDVLLLKGHAFPGMMGMGAVHRSPPMHAEDDDEGCLVGDGEEEQEAAAAAAAGVRRGGGAVRLVLTVDDAVVPPCDCCPPGADVQLEVESQHRTICALIGGCNCEL